MITLRTVRLTEDGHIDPAEHAIFMAWWKGHGWPGIPANLLPKVGIVAEKEGQGLCVGWLYLDNSRPISMLEWLVSNPEANLRDVFIGFKMLLEFMGQHALDMGYAVMLTTCRTPSLIKLYERGGFTKTDEGVTHLIRVLCK